MTKQIIFLAVTLMLAIFLTSCASIQNTEYKPGGVKTNYDRNPL